MNKLSESTGNEPSFSNSKGNTSANKKKKLTDLAYEMLEEQIITLKIPPGTSVTETELCELTGIGRTPVREAIHRLSRESLIIIMPQRGLIIADIDVKKQLRLLDFRREVERFIVVCAAQKASEPQRNRFIELAELLEQAAAADDELLFVRCDREFNLLCLEASRNEFVTASMQLMHGLSRRFWYYHHKQSADVPTMAHLHSMVASTIAKGDKYLAAKALDELLNYVEDYTKATIFYDD